ncbi:MAG TPA: hypothetical protein VFY84_05710 [Jiangellales bacterium]|nr:hypothetical protein [Jiangellales bacterium]
MIEERYVRLGLQLGRQVEGVVDAYFGPPELAAAVMAAPPLEPRALVAEADALLDELDDGWLRDQVRGIRAYAGILAGESRSFAAEAKACYGVRPAYTDEAVFAAAHERLDELLPGSGSLAERREHWKNSTVVPADRLERTVAAVIGAARVRTQALVDLPDGEGVDLELVHDEPWLAYNYYLGGLRGRVAVNADLPMSATELLHLAIHETYPGHQAERSIKEHLLVTGRGMLEESLVLVPTPQSLITEGIAELAPHMLLDGDGGTAFAAVFAESGIEVDLAHGLAVERAAEPCRWAEVNAALMLHEESRSDAEVREYLQRWGLMSPDLAAHLIRFMTDRTSRTYVMTYPAGYELCSRYVSGDRDRFRELLTRQVRVRDLLDAVSETR